MKDLALVIRNLQNNNMQAFDQIVDLYQNRLFTFLLRFVGDQHEAEDLLQECFVKIFSHIKSYEHREKFEHWMMRIASNLAYDFLRKKKRRKITYVDLKERDISYSVEKTFSEKEKKEIFLNALQYLSLEQRQVFLLRQQGVSFQEISQNLRIPLNTALARMRYAIQKLKKAFAIKGEKCVPRK